MKKRLLAFAIAFLSIPTVSIFAQALEPTPDFESGGFIEASVPGEGESFTSSVNSGVLPASSVLTYSVTNISMDNQDAQVSGAREGDVLRYQVSINSQTEGIYDFVTSVDITEILQTGEIINAELGEINGNTITFPAFSQDAPCERIFSFFVRVSPCNGKSDINSSAHGRTNRVAIQCNLVESGPGEFLSVFGVTAIVAIFFFAFMTRRRVN